MVGKGWKGDNKKVAHQGGDVAKAARKQLEDTTKKNVVTSNNAKALKIKNKELE